MLLGLTSGLGFRDNYQAVVYNAYGYNYNQCKLAFGDMFGKVGMTRVEWEYIDSALTLFCKRSAYLDLKQGQR